MRIIIFCFCLLSLSGLVFSQQSIKTAAKKNTVQPETLQAGQEQKSVNARKAPVQKVEQGDDEGGVVIDDRSETGPTTTQEADDESEAREPEQTKVLGGMPASYGVLKTAFTENGKNFLLFENEEGTLSFVNIFLGKKGFSWKLISQLRRSAD